MLKAAATLFLSLLLTTRCFAADSAFAAVDGIWQNIYFPYEYYSIHTNDNTLVLVDLYRIEGTASTLRSAFSGKLGNDFKAQLILTQQAPDYPDVGSNNGGYLQISLRFSSATQADIGSLCVTCLSRIIVLNKRF